MGHQSDCLIHLTLAIRIKFTSAAVTPWSVRLGSIGAVPTRITPVPATTVHTGRPYLPLYFARVFSLSWLSTEVPEIRVCSRLSTNFHL